MLKILQVTYDYFQEFDKKYRDHRSENYFILGSPLQFFGLLVFYYVFVKHLGPKLMEKCDPFELKNLMLVYNLVQVFLNVNLFVRVVWQFVADDPYDNLSCIMPLDRNSRLGRIELHFGYYYFLLKIFDYMDTVFSVLRKRYKQVNFLHVYHHIMISLGAFLYTRYLPGGHTVALGAFNALVHSFMYFYYFISALRPELKKSLWWKKHITQLQIVQFLFLIVYFALPTFNRNCPYPKFASLFVLIQNVVMAVLFLDFYYKAYLRKPKVSPMATKTMTAKMNESTKLD